ncbi:hypothetical protein ABN028_32065 [Actinopolymorpha sp. B17G11]|uniref:hypothetical protein n=1 Tax=unclassified Actinopolymorpha TaxID=2627063 RepID=UPI0032D99EE6
MDSFVNNKVDDCFDALESRCEAVATAIRAMADAQEALNESIEDAANTSVVGATAGAIAGGGATLMTAGAGSAVIVAMLSAIVTSIVTWTYEAWSIYQEFVADCLESLDKLGVSVKSHGVQVVRGPAMGPCIDSYLSLGAGSGFAVSSTR